MGIYFEGQEGTFANKQLFGMALADMTLHTLLIPQARTQTALHKHIHTPGTRMQ